MRFEGLKEDDRIIFNKVISNYNESKNPDSVILLSCMYCGDKEVEDHLMDMAVDACDGKELSLIDK